MRNQFAGLITAIRQGPVNDEIDVMVNGMQIITASITHESSRDLQLAIGSKVFALIKASSVMIGNKHETHARNHYPATVRTIIRGEQTSELVMQVSEELVLVSTLRNADLDRLALIPGSISAASFTPSSVIVGIAA